MKYSKPITTTAVAAIVMTAMLPLTPVSANQGHGTEKTSQYHTKKSKEQAPKLFDDTIQSTVVKGKKGKNRPVKVKTELLAKDALTLTLFDDQIVTAVRDRVVKVKGSITWVGHIEDEPDSEVFLTVKKKTMSGTIRIGTDLFEISLSKNGLHKITHLNPGENPDFEDDTIIVEDLLLENEQIDTIVSSDPLIANAEENIGTIIDLMVVYTPQSRLNASGQSGIETKIVNAVAKANQAYINSKVDMQINIVHMSEINYTETGTMLTSLTDIRSNNDGKMDEVHSLRDQYGADQVVLISADIGSCGLAYVMNNPSSSFAPYAFSVVHDDSQYACLSNQTLAHELGHNQGDQHDTDSANTSGAYDYSYGYRLCQMDGFRTVMSYHCSGGTRVGQFSNPNVLYNGEYTGTSTEDNARSMNNTKSIVASFRRTVDISTPTSPNDLVISAVSDTEITISWMDNAHNETGFRIERSSDQLDWHEIAVIDNNITSFTDTGLSSETMYWYRVRAFNSNGYSAYSNINSATTEITETTVQTTTVVENCTHNAPLFTIVPSTKYSQAGAKVTYHIDFSNEDSLLCEATTFTLTTNDDKTIGYYPLNAGDSTSLTWEATAPLIDGDYTNLVMLSTTAHDEIKKSATIIVDGTTPSMPSNLSAVIKRRSKVLIDWDLSTDSGSGLSHYLIKRDGIPIKATTRTRFVDKPGKGTFTYTVEALDKVGNTQGDSVSIKVGRRLKKDKSKNKKK